MSRTGLTLPNIGISKSGKQVRKFRICVLGPSFVGKTQIVNRFVNNGFSSYYEPTLKAQIFRKAFNTMEDQDVDPQYVDLEIMDLFPHDHPLLDKEADYNELAKEMSTTLNDIVKNAKAQEKIHGFMFVFDSSNKFTFETLTCLIETIKEIEKSERRGKKAMLYAPKKIVIGNKKDLKKRKQVLEKGDLKRLEGMRYREVSAMTNQGIFEAFKVLITDVHSDNILHKEFFDQQKLKNKNIEDLKEFDEANERMPKHNTMLGMIPFFGCYGVSQGDYLNCFRRLETNKQTKMRTTKFPVGKKDLKIRAARREMSLIAGQHLGLLLLDQPPPKFPAIKKELVTYSEQQQLCTLTTQDIIKLLTFTNEKVPVARKGRQI